MDCPACNFPIREQKLPDGSVDFSCPKCGWGKGGAAYSRHDEPARPSAGRVAIFILAALLVVFGPYLALRIGIPILFDTGSQAFAEASDRLIAALNFHYWWIMALYIMLSALISPSYDRENLGWLGGFVDNPFSWQDDWERQKRAWAFFFAPGKAVVVAGVLTWQLVAAGK